MCSQPNNASILISPPDNRPPVSVVLLASNEAPTIVQEVRAFHEIIVQKLPGSELIVAEDGSRDGTTEVLTELKKSLDFILISCPGRKGYAQAFRDAVLATRNNLVFFSDTGLKHDPHDFWALYAKINQFDLVLGRKVDRHDQWYRRLLTWGYNTLLRAYFKQPAVHDADSGFRLFNQTVVDRVLKPGLRFKYLVGSEMVLRALAEPLRYCEVPVSYAQRVGESKGMPLHSIGRQIRTVLKDLRALKQEMTAAGSRTHA